MCVRRAARVVERRGCGENGGVLRMIAAGRTLHHGRHSGVPRGANHSHTSPPPCRTGGREGLRGERGRGEGVGAVRTGYRGEGGVKGGDRGRGEGAGAVRTGYVGGANGNKDKKGRDLRKRMGRDLSVRNGDRKNGKI